MMDPIFPMTHEPDPLGIDDGETCNRIAEPDEDEPRGYKPKPCNGDMIDDAGLIICEYCGEVAG